MSVNTSMNGEEKIAALRGRVHMVESRVEVKKTQVALALAAAIRQNLQAVLGEKIKHFEVTATPGSMGFEVCVKFADEIGSYIYYGTRPHPISSSDAMPIGGGKFAMSVSHPGTASMKESIDSAVATAVISVRQIARLR